MKNLTTSSKIEKIILKELDQNLIKWESQLEEGQLYKFEKELEVFTAKVQNSIAAELLKVTSANIFEKLKKEGEKAGGKKITARLISLKTSTGYTVKITSPYVKDIPMNWDKSRHLLPDYWKIKGSSSPLLYDKVSFSSMLCSSYDLATELLNRFNVKINPNCVRNVTNCIAQFCNEHGEENFILKKGENLSSKTVIISMDGGRTRTRDYDGKMNESNNPTFKTPWREPKLFVIDIINEAGKMDKHHLPIYGCRFGEKDMLELLEKYLIKLEIHKATKVQIIADGAPWIWNNIKPLLLKLNLEEDVIVETLDYYHASEYIHDIVNKMPKRISQKQKTAYLELFKKWLWEGSSNEILRVCKNVFKRPCSTVRRWMNYIGKHQNKTQYSDYKDLKLLCGSGIIESAVRRIINLRFKSASSFWNKETVEKLYCLRAAALSKRWNIMMFNITNS